MPANSRWDLIRGLKGQSYIHVQIFSRSFFGRRIASSLTRKEMSWNVTDDTVRPQLGILHRPGGGKPCSDDKWWRYWSRYYLWHERGRNSVISKHFDEVRIIHIGNPTRCNSVATFYFIFIWNSSCFGRHTAHHQEPKTALAASGFACVEG